MKTYTIKPLEWWEGEGGSHFAMTPVVKYSVGYLDGAIRWGFLESGDDHMEYHQCGSIEQGKAAAEEAWIQLVEQLLIPQS